MIEKMPQTEGLGSKKRRVRQVSGTQIMFAVILAIGLMLAINFSGRVTADRQLRDVQIAVEREIETLRREQGELVKQLDYVKGDAYVEAWARSEGRMVKEGEVLIVPFPAQPVSATSTDALPPIAIENPETRLEPWELWWSLFFDAPPPRF